MKKTCFPLHCMVLIHALVITMLLYSSASAVSLEDANIAYDQRNYAEATTMYTTLLEREGYSANLLYNLANSYAQQGKTGKAVVNYLRALHLSPFDPDIESNMKRTLEQAGVYDEEKPPHEKVATLLSLDQWSLVALFCLVALTLFLICVVFFRQHRRIFQMVSMVTFLTLLTSSFGIAISYQKFSSSIVITPDNPLRISPFENAATTGSIQEGKRVKVISEHGNYVFVEDSIARNGWLPKNSVESIK